MDLDEKQAKQILDILASKIKHAVFTLKLTNAWPATGMEYVVGQYLCSSSSLKVSRPDNKEKYVLADNFESCKQCLEHLLDLSKDGYSIEVYPLAVDVYPPKCIQFLKPFSTLEQLLVESDLALASL